MRKLLLSMLILLTVFSCKTVSNRSSATPSGPRTIRLDGKLISADKVGGLISWNCKSYVHGGKTLVEVGYFGSPDLEGVGFILYDGGYSGKKIHYRRAGLKRRWEWGSNGENYAFIIKPNGVGLYYDFTMSKGESVKPNSVYKCYKR